MANEAESGTPRRAAGTGERDRRAILVLGMHRSGTSAVARLLGLCGAALPRDGWSSDEHNETGYWEPAAVIRLHEEFLAANGSAFDDVAGLPKGWRTSPLASELADRLAGVLEEDYGEATLWVVKDPRLCRLVPLWRDVLERLRVTPLAVLPIRNPLEVAASLGARDQFSLSKSLLLWLRHFLEAEAATRGMPRSFVLYESVLRDWRNVLGRIARDLGVDWPTPVEDAAPEVDRFLDPVHRHHRASTDDLVVRPEVNAWIKSTYQWALEAAQGHVTPTSVLDATADALATADIAFVPLLEDGRREHVRVRQVEDELAALAEQLTARDARNAELQSALDQVEVGRMELRRRWLRLRGELSSIHESTSWRLSAPLRWLERRRSRAHDPDRRGPMPTAARLAYDPVRLWRQKRLLRASGLFDGGWYLRQNSDVAESRADPLLHYLRFGASEGRNPNPLFDTSWYLRQNPDVARSRLNPLAHYLLFGGAEGRDPSPAFDTRWYLAEHEDAAESGLNPLAHHLRFGEDRNRPTRPPAEAVRSADGPTVTVDGSVRAYVRQVLATPLAVHDSHRTFQKLEKTKTDVKAIAFYLPQFHPIPENDQWWGRGFTEWTNVSRAVPQFLGHYQPRLPGELGFYDLRLPEIQRRQVELAQSYGIHALCFYFYWFGGKRLLERPLDQFVADDSLEMDFCVCWANENWSHRWDGSTDEILIAQRHSSEEDRSLIRELMTLFEDPRYLRVGGRPILVVYRVDTLPRPTETADRWRQLCRDNGVGEILLVAAQTFGIEDPQRFGFDAAVEFPPHGSRGGPMTEEMEALNPAFSGAVVSYEELADQFERRRPPSYPLIRAVCPSWDNTPRTLERGRVFHGSTPARYGRWLEVACRYAEAHPLLGERLVFINAWNEWAEGAYLEPDRRYGYAYLEATRSALTSWRRHSPDG